MKRNGAGKVPFLHRNLCPSRPSLRMCPPASHPLAEPPDQCARCNVTQDAARASAAAAPPKQRPALQLQQQRPANAPPAAREKENEQDELPAEDGARPSAADEVKWRSIHRWAARDSAAAAGAAPQGSPAGRKVATPSVDGSISDASGPVTQPPARSPALAAAEINILRMRLQDMDQVRMMRERESLPAPRSIDF